jgi:hypothetical protein
MKNITCPNCSHGFTHSSIIGKALGTTIGGLANGNSPGKALVSMGIGWIAGHVLDQIIVEVVDPQCPECGFVIRGIIDAMSTK